MSVSIGESKHQNSRVQGASDWLDLKTLHQNEYKKNSVE